MVKLERFWRRFQSAPTTQQDAVHIRQAFTAKDFYASDVIAVLRALGDDVEASSAAMRVYVEGSQSYALADRVIHDPPGQSENLEEWSVRISEGRTFGLILNYVEQWNDDLSRKLALFLRPLHEDNAIEQHTFEVNLFIGNYGYTPFGAHWDDRYASIIHFHLGPNPKTITLWSPARYKQITGSERSHFQPEMIVKFGRSYRLNSGDLFLLPPNYFHVGLTKNFSVGIAVVVSPQNPNRILEAALAAASEELARKFRFSSSATFKQGMTRTRRAISQSREPLPGWMTASVDRYLVQQRSLLGFCTKPRERAGRLRITRNKRVALSVPFKICSLKKSDTLHLFVRGVEITLRANSAVEDLVRRINSGDVLLVKDLIARYSEQLEEKAILHLISLVYKYRAVDIAE